MGWFDHLAVQGTLKSLLQHHSSKVSILPAHLYLFIYLFITSRHDYLKTHTFEQTDLVSKVMSLLLNMLSRFVIAFLLRSKHLLISWPQALSTRLRKMSLS